MKRKVNSYTDDFKLKVVQDYLMSDATVSEIQKKYGIRSRSCISDWVRKYGLESPTQRTIELHNAMKEQNQRTPREEELELKVEQLKKELERERLRTLTLNTMIDIAERELKIKVRKNSGAKQ
jgi:transposase-like protein